jgi:hypothetical protein
MRRPRAPRRKLRLAFGARRRSDLAMRRQPPGLRHDKRKQTLPGLLERITDAALTRAAGTPRDDIMLLALRLSAR